MKLKELLDRQKIEEIDNRTALIDSESWMGNFKLKYDHSGWCLVKKLITSVLDEENIETIEEIKEKVEADDIRIREESPYFKVEFFFEGEDPELTEEE